MTHEEYQALTRISSPEAARNWLKFWRWMTAIYVLASLLVVGLIAFYISSISSINHELVGNSFWAMCAGFLIFMVVFSFFNYFALTLLNALRLPWWYLVVMHFISGLGLFWFYPQISWPLQILRGTRNPPEMAPDYMLDYQKPQPAAWLDVKRNRIIATAGGGLLFLVMLLM